MEKEEEDRSLRWVGLRTVEVLVAWIARQVRMVIVEASGKEGSLAVARGRGREEGFDLIQQDVRCCYV